MVLISSKYRKKVIYLCPSFLLVFDETKRSCEAVESGAEKSDEMKMFLFQIRKVRGIVPGGCLHQREVRLAQVSCGIVAGHFAICSLDIVEHRWILLNIVIHCWILLNIVKYCWTLLRVSFQYVLICYNMLQLFEKCSIPNFCPSHRHSHQMFTAFSISYKFVSNQYFQYQISLYQINIFNIEQMYQTKSINCQCDEFHFCSAHNMPQRHLLNIF